MSRTCKLSFLFAFCAVLALSPGWAAQPKFTSIDYPDPGATATLVYGINASGEMVGGWYDAANHEHGFLLSRGTFTSIDYPVGATWTEAWGINAEGDIVGQYGLIVAGNKTVHGFLLRKGSFYPLDVPGQPNTMPVKISANGTIVGCYHVATAAGATILDTMHGFTMTGDGVTSYPTARTMHNGVNEEGDIVGLLFAADNVIHYSYLIHDGVTTLFQFPAAFATQAWDISPTGATVGFYRLTQTGTFHGFLRQGEETTSLDVPGALHTRAYGINPSGEIVGYYTESTGRNHGFLLSRH